MFTRSFGIVALVLALPLSSTTVAQDKKDKKGDATTIEIAGQYSTARKVLGGKTDEGVVSIAADGDGYTVSWVFDSGAKASGLALRTDDKLAVGWKIEFEENLKKKTTTGTSLFTITVKDGKPVLKGHWIDMDGSGVKFEEELTFLRARKK